VSAELNARRTAAAAVLGDYKAAVASAPLGSPPGREWMLRLASVLGDLLAVLEQDAAEDTRARCPDHRPVWDSEVGWYCAACGSGEAP
jgi:hypothetical protein